jgi:hypothetical protein
VAQVVEHLPSKHEATCKSYPLNAKRKKGKEKVSHSNIEKEVLYQNEGNS